MNTKISRRAWLGAAAGAAVATLPGTKWIFAVGEDGEIVKSTALEDIIEWKPVFLSRKQAGAIANLAESIIPRTETAGARDARVHEYIDLSLSIESEVSQERFKTQLKWMEKYAKRLYHKPLKEMTTEECTKFLTPLSDVRQVRPKALDTGTAFFRDLKRRVIFGYYTSLEGRVELGLRPEVGMETWQGCK